VRLAGIEPAALRSGVRPGALQTGRFEFATCRFRPSNIALFHPGCYTVATRRRPAAKAKARVLGLFRCSVGLVFPGGWAQLVVAVGTALPWLNWRWLARRPTTHQHGHSFGAGSASRVMRSRQSITWYPLSQSVRISWNRHVCSTRPKVVWRDGAESCRSPCSCWRPAQPFKSRHLMNLALLGLALEGDDYRNGFASHRHLEHGIRRW
jgi:hypothetical protein